MANGEFNTDADFETGQAERAAIFDKIKPAENWKNPIDAWIAESDLPSAATRRSGSPAGC